MIVVRRAGLLTTVQDRGRVGRAHLGVPRAGAADPAALRRANRLVGNPADAAGLEITRAGPELELTAPGVVAVTGAPGPVECSGVPMPHATPVAVGPGDVLTWGPMERGVRAYLGVRGGIAVEPVLGSRSTCTLSGLGPPVLSAGDRLPVGRDPGEAVPDPPPPEPPWRDEGVLRVVLGPRADAFVDPAVLLAGDYVVTGSSDRTGARLQGPALVTASAAELPSEGMVRGALQVPPDGQPILFLANHPTTGGYPVVAVVVDDDLAVAAQARPGARLRFAAVDD